MSFDKLNQLFDDAVRRFKKSPPVSDPYRSDPLASDHLLLEKGWAYFTERTGLIEKQYKQLLDARDQTIAALEKQMNELKKRAQEFEEKQKDQDELNWGLAESRIKDFLLSDKELAQLKARWEEERIRLEEMNRALEAKLEMSEAEKKNLQNRWRATEASLRAGIEGANAEMEKVRLERADAERDFLRRATEKEEREAGLYQKIDILRGEVAAKSELVQKLTVEKNRLSNKINEAEDEKLDLTKALQERDAAAGHLRDEIALLKKEKDIIEKNWRAEQAEWRELWDRQREMWEKSRKKSEEE